MVILISHRRGLTSSKNYRREGDFHPIAFGVDPGEFASILDEGDRMKGRYCDALKPHRFSEMCLTKRILASARVDLGLAGFTARRGTEAGFGALLLREVSESLKWVVSVEIRGIPASLFAELLRAVTDTLSFLTFG